jgi:CHAT domain-containing protein/Flp pilus assembly protein TadD
MGAAGSALAEGRYRDALDIYLRLPQIFEDVYGAGTPNIAAAQFNIGLTYLRLGDYAKAIEYCEPALAELSRALGGEHPNIVPVLITLGLAYQDMGDYARDVEYTRRALDICLKVYGEEHPSTALSLSNLGVGRSLLGDYAGAIEYGQRALAVRLRLFGEEHPDTASSLSNLGVNYRDSGDYARGIEYGERALAIRLRLFGEEHRDTASSLNNLGNAYGDSGNYAKAIEHHQRALPIYFSTYGGEHPETAAFLNSLGNAYSNLGDHARAIEHYQRSFAVYLKAYGEGHPETAAPLSNLGNAYGSLGDYPKAIEHYQRVLAVYLKTLGEGHLETAMVLSNLGKIYSGMGDYAKAIEHGERSLAALLRLFGDEHPHTALILNNLAFDYNSLGDYAKGEEYGGRALAAYAKTLGARHPGMVMALYNLAVSRAGSDRPDSAVFYLKQAVNILQAARWNISELDENLQKSFLKSKESYYRSLAGLLVAQGRVAEAQQVLAMLKEEEFFDFIRRDGSNDPRGVRVSYSPREQERADVFTAIAERLFEARANGQEALVEEAGEYLRIFAANLERDLTSGGSAERDEAIAAMDLAGLRPLQKKLRDMGHGAVLLQTVMDEERLLLILTTPDGQVAREVPVSREELNWKIAAFREGIKQLKDVAPMARDLYGAVAGPVAGDLEDAGARTIMLSLDGQLRYMPVAALHDGRQWLAEKYALAVYTEAARDKLQDRRDSSRWAAAALGVTKAHPGFSKLPAVGYEVEAIAEEMSGAVYLDEDFTASAFGGVLAAGVPVVHVASHFNFDPAGTAADSFLLLGDGTYLTLEDIGGGYFQFGGVEQLTFSACQTAMGTGEGTGREVEGLGVLAQKRGAKSVTAALWSIADVSTGIFMPRFYELLRQGATKAEALRRTQAEFIAGSIGGGSAPAASASRSASAFSIGRAPALSSRGASASSSAEGVPTEKAEKAGNLPGQFAHPFFWAPFILMGNWL